MSLVQDSGPVVAWRCIGCGRIEAPRDCIGVCDYRKVTLADSAEADALRAELQAARARLDAMTGVLRRIAGTTPREGALERTWAALQSDARRVLRAGEADPT